ncbi:hypothetical protein Franean1_0064 [Parafrankia sp. EAN1pec]|nr:hypothetical protein Franean1_0064 [Frankia sp. EAN1pec]
MSRRATAITLTREVRAVLAGRVRSSTVPRRDWLRAAIVLAAADGVPNTTIATDLGVCEDTVGKWRGRFAREGLAGLADRPRSGRPARCRSPRSRRRRVPGPRTSVRRWNAGRTVNSPATRPDRASWRACRRRRSGAGWPVTRSAPGSTDRGSSPEIRRSS